MLVPWLQVLLITRKYSAVVDLHVFQFAVAHAVGLSVFTSRLLATDLNTEISTSGHYEVFLLFRLQSLWSLGTKHFSGLTPPAYDWLVTALELEQSLHSLVCTLHCALVSHSHSYSQSKSSQSKSKSKLCYDRRSVGQSFLVQAPIWGLRPDIYYYKTVAGLVMWGVLSGERKGLPFTIAAGLGQCSHSWVRVPPDSWLHFTVSDSDSHNLKGQVLVFISPRRRVAQLAAGPRYKSLHGPYRKRRFQLFYFLRACFLRPSRDG
jgi:hypothetical protein